MSEIARRLRDKTALRFMGDCKCGKCQLVPRAEIDEAAAYIERLEAALEKIVGWSEAYPLSIFPEPDFKKAHEVLTKAGMTLDAISASNMRHVVKGVGEIARAALSR